MNAAVVQPYLEAIEIVAELAVVVPGEDAIPNRQLGRVGVGHINNLADPRVTPSRIGAGAARFVGIAQHHRRAPLRTTSVRT